MSRQDLLVIGGGPGGLVVASVASQLGLRVTLAEKSTALGGDCLHSGCVPSKTLIHSARIAHLMRHAGRYGLTPVEPQIEFDRIIDRVEAVIAHIQKHDDPERFRGYGCDVRFGPARFISAHTVAVGEEVVHSRRFVIATGSQPAVPPIPGLEEGGYFTNENIFTHRVLPRRLAVIGGGPIGLELAQSFSRFGSQVTVIELADRILSVEDNDVSALLAKSLAKEGIRILTSSSVTGVRRDGDSRQLSLSDGSTLECDRILIATGRRPAVEGLGLEEAGVNYNKKGILVDRRLRTSQRHIYAVGDVCGPYQFTHMAEYQAGIAIANLVFRFPKKADYRIIPHVTFTDPEVAQVGLTETAAQARGLDFDVARFPMAEVDRAITESATAGFAKLLMRKGRIIGACVVGPHAGELIHELALAMSVNAKARDISSLVHAYPTYAQVHRRAVNASYAHMLQSRKVRFLAWALNRLLP